MLHALLIAMLAFAAPADDAPEGMVYIPAGEFAMGSAHPLGRPDELPIHRVRVDAFYIDTTEVTNAQFKAFVDATGYVTVAERPVDWEELKKQVPPGTPKPADEALAPGSLVFTPPGEDVDLRRYDRWWQWTHGAAWKEPEGPGSSIEDRMDHPVVHVALEDAHAYAAWAGKRLPTEAEWEYAARGGLDGADNTWGDEPISPGRANTWQGRFPRLNTEKDGFYRTAPVGSFPANGYGLVDTAGNVWEWTVDAYIPDLYARRGAEAPIDNPRVTATEAEAVVPGPARFVQRGGSFLCNDTYCASYRPAARMPNTPDSAASHVGFRCVKDVN